MSAAPADPAALDGIRRIEHRVPVGYDITIAVTETVSARAQLRTLTWVEGGGHTPRFESVDVAERSWRHVYDFLEV